MFSQCRRPGVQNVATGHLLRITGRRKMAMKTVSKDEAASSDDEVVPSDAGPIVEIDF